MSRWKTIAVKLEPSMYTEIQEYAESGEFDSLGASVRDLLAHGLEASFGRTGVEERVIRANAAAAAKRRLHLLMDAAVKAFAQDFELEGEDDENIDTQFTYDEDN